MFSLRSLFKTKPNVEIAQALYGTTILAARRPFFFTECGVPDTPEGRFEMLALSAFLVLNRMKNFADMAELSQTYFDVMFDDIDSNLRELGVGDISVGKKVKKLAQSFYGRIKAYEAGLHDESDGALSMAIERDLLRGTSPERANIEKLVKYVRAEHDFLSRQDADSLAAGRISFVDLSDVFQ
ncbi:MAG: ubiquinol-cytochrome C chaperone [Rhodospirillales bacterium]|nr:ubiquinol-cytochrome C chaperone [Rhodospirillales bacterium]